MAGLDDGGGCLMDEINALFAPPGRGGDKNRGNAKNTELHPYFKRPGKLTAIFENRENHSDSFKTPLILIYSIVAF